jgi:hypothetical protein
MCDTDTYTNVYWQGIVSLPRNWSTVIISLHFKYVYEDTALYWLTASGPQSAIKVWNTDILWSWTAYLSVGHTDSLSWLNDENGNSQWFWLSYQSFRHAKCLWSWIQDYSVRHTDSLCWLNDESIYQWKFIVLTQHLWHRDRGCRIMAQVKGHSVL